MSLESSSNRGVSDVEFNPYSMLNMQQIDEIIRYRDVDVGRDLSQARNLLRQLDDIDPTFRNRATNIEYSPRISLALLLYRAAALGVDLNLETFGKYELLDYLSILTFGSQADVNITIASPDVIYKVSQVLGITPQPPLYSVRNLRDRLLGRAGLLPPDPKIKQRYEEFSKLLPSQASKLLRFYNCNTIQCFIDTPIAMIEPYFYLAIKDPRKVAKLLGMVIPFGYPLASYVVDNVLEYNTALERSPTLKYPDIDNLSNLAIGAIETTLAPFTDKELLDYVGVNIGYESRQSLLHNLASLISGREMFFVPLHRRCSNPETVLLSDTSDPTLRIFAFGTLNNYQCYEADELETGFGEYDGIFEFRIPGLSDEFTEEELQSLLDLIRYSRSSRSLRDKIISGFEEQRRLIQSMSDTQALFRILSRNEKDVVRDYLDTLFNAGMYMRRWQGTGCYPLLEQDTRTDVEPAILSTPALQHLRDIYSTASKKVKAVLNSLRVIERHSGELRKSTSSIIENYINPVYTGDVCIRVASTRFALTAYKYLQELFQYTIPNFDPLTIEYII